MTSNDTPTSTSNGVTSSAPISTASDSSGASMSDPVIAQPASTARAKHIGAIVGGTLGGVLVLFGVLFTVLMCRRSRPADAEPHSSAPGGRDTPATMLSFGNGMIERSGRVATYSAPLENTDLPLEEQMRRLQAEVELLRVDQAGLRSSVGSRTADESSVTRSLATMKNAQTHALNQSYGQAAVRDSLVQTEGGMNLTAERFEDELPPTYHGH
ncbi:hypothetical protein B0H17DRAFT_1144095 [Mycena rosella]|uniref:Uncharacterized protein n=1 Tax=Mycena rosella TaxID=1033263 RepID=A0AAD7CXJ5_MYCRO|nr:hypothetical protein B0H17DRAFT_1144095 [Mycena rosella]